MGGTPIQVVSNGAATCVLFRDGGVRCSGRGAGVAQMLPATWEYPSPALGADEDPAAVPLVDVGGAVVQLAAGFAICALLDTGAIRCWGYCSVDGEDYHPLTHCLGYGEAEEVVGDDEAPAQMGDVPVGERAVQVSTSGSTTCVVLERGGLRCWGHESAQSAGAPTVIDASLAQDVALDLPVKRVAAGAGAVCALGREGTVVCWGGDASSRANGHGDGDPIGEDEAPVTRGPIPLPSR